jgi:hypothetical protein
MTARLVLAPESATEEMVDGAGYCGATEEGRDYIKARYSLMLAARPPVTDEMLEVLLPDVAKAIEAADEKPAMIPCPRCEGRGYHHGFGEDGHDPDWCVVCGGGQHVRDPLGQARAALRKLRDMTAPCSPAGDRR